MQLNRLSEALAEPLTGALRVPVSSSKFSFEETLQEFLKSQPGCLRLGAGARIFRHLSGGGA